MTSPTTTQIFSAASYTIREYHEFEPKNESYQMQDLLLVHLFTNAALRLNVYQNTKAHSEEFCQHQAYYQS